MLARDKLSSLLRKFVNYGRNKFYDTGSGFFGNTPVYFQSKPVKQEVNGTVILPPLLFLGLTVDKDFYCETQHANMEFE
jgi:hypothetical protein